MQLGLKLWSINTDAYLNEARRLYADKVFDYLELYVVPGSEASLTSWVALRDETGVPVVIHAPHSKHGVNFSDAALRADNSRIFREVQHYADALKASAIIVHGGWYPIGDDATRRHAELAAQLERLSDDRLVLENKPYLPVDATPRYLMGSSPNEIIGVLQAVGCGFCLDIGHMISSANAHSSDWRSWFDDFLLLKPSLFHLSDLDLKSKVDQHLHLGAGTLPLREIVSQLPKSAMISIETVRDSKTDLKDFERDVAWLRAL